MSGDASQAFEGIDARIWRAQPTFDQLISATSQVDQINAEGGFAVSFSPYRRAGIDLHFVGSQTRNISLWTTVSKGGFVSKPKLSTELFAIRFFTSGSMLRRNKPGDAVIGSVGCATFLTFEDMLEDRASSDFSALTATVTRQALSAACEALDGKGPRPLPTFAPVADMVGVGMLALRRSLCAMHHRLQSGIGRDDLLFDLLEELIVYQIISAWPKMKDEAVVEPVHPSGREMRLAIDYIEANLQRRMTIAEIATAAGMGVRSLQAAFRRHLEVPPIQYVINRRLDRVRDILVASSGELTIQQVARQWGFVHMSDFARRYRRRFGCTPKMSHGQR